MNPYYYEDGEICKQDCSVKWAIQDIFWFPKNFNIEIISPTFYFAEIKWRLRVFPWGRKVSKVENTSGWLGVALSACGTHDILDGKQLSIRFSIIGKTGEVACAVAGKRLRWYVADKLLRSKRMKPGENEITPDNVLTIQCEIQNEELTKSETESDGGLILEAAEAGGILYENVSIGAEAVCGSYSQTSISHKDDSTAQNCAKKNISGDLSSASSDTEAGSFYFSVSSTDVETEGFASEEEHDRTIYENTPNVGEQLSALPKGVARALQNYKELLRHEIHSDITIQVRNKQFKAHRNILAAQTPVFAAVLKHNMREKATGVVPIEDMDPETFPDFLEYLYTGQVQNLTSSNVLGLFTVADKYQVMELREECFVFMKENLSVENFCGILSLALRHQEKELVALATQFFIDNAVDIVKTSKWQVFMIENAVAANELFIKQLEFNSQKQKQT